jgi:hypothetical protein
MGSFVAASCGSIRRYCRYLRSIVSSPFRWFNRACSRRRSIAEISDLVHTVLYLARARQVAGPVLHVVDGAHGGRW